jgi:hypothetical protein
LGANGGPTYGFQGALVLTGGATTVKAATTLKTGSLTVQGGALQVDGTLTAGGTAGLSGGTLKGTGTIASSLANSGGTVAPGDSPGMLTIAGNYTQEAGGTLAIAIAGSTPGSQFSQLKVGGAATLGGTVSVTDEGAFVPTLNEPVEIITGASSRTGTFATVSGPSAGIYTPKYEAHSVTLIATNPPPSVTEVSPEEGAEGGGTSVAITGTNFNGATAVTFGPTKAKGFKVNSATSITAESPAGSGTVDVTVTTPGGTTPTSGADHFAYVPPPTITEVSPKEGPEAGGTTVNVTGTNLSGASAVVFGPNNAKSFKVNSATSITAESPAGKGTTEIVVTTPGGRVAANFTYVPPPTVAEVTPNNGPEAGGTSVTIAGTNFTGATAVKFGISGAKAFKVNSATSITAESPMGSGTVDVIVTTAGGTSATGQTDHFSYGPPPRWFSNGVAIPNGQLVALKTKGTASFAVFKTTLACKLKGSMSITNTPSGGTDSITAFALKCKLQNQPGSSCPKPGKVGVLVEQLPWASRLAISQPSVTDEIVPGNPAVPEIRVKCSTGGAVSFSGGFTPTVGEGVLEFGAGQPLVGSIQLKGPKHARITAH